MMQLYNSNHEVHKIAYSIWICLNIRWYMVCMASTKVMKFQLGVHDINVMTAW